VEVRRNPLRDVRVWIGLGVSALFLVLLLRQVDPDELGEAVAGVRVEWLVLALAVYFSGLWVRGLRWRLVLQPYVRLTTADCFALLVIGYAANNVLPVRAGELVRAGLLQQRHGTPWAAGLGSIVVERVLDGLVLAAMLAITVLLAGGNGALKGLALIAGAAFVAVFAVLVALGASGAARPHTAQRLLRRLPESIRPRIEDTLARFAEGLTALRGPRTWALVVGATAASWTLEAAAYWLVGVGFGLDLAPPLYFAVCGAANLAIAAPSTAGGVGPFEFFARSAAVAYGAGRAVATAYALVLHALILLPVVLLALVLLWRRHLGVGTLVGGRAPATSEPGS
jgi:hypothetical protein